MRKRIFFIFFSLLISISLCACDGSNFRRINLNDYISVEFDGLDKVGSAIVRFDTEALYLDHLSDVKFKDRDAEAVYSKLYSYGRETDPIDALRSCISWTLDKKAGLKNGDTIVLTWNIDENTVQKYLKCNLTYETQTYEVNGLQFNVAADIQQYITYNTAG